MSMSIPAVIISIIAAAAVVGIAAAGLTGGIPAVFEGGMQTTPITPTTQMTAAPATGAVVDTIPAAAATSKPAVSDEVQKQGAELLAGNWYGDKSLMFGVVSGKFYASGAADGTATFSGAIKAPGFGYENAEFETPAVWTYLGENRFVATINEVETVFTCDGTTLTIILNAYKLGFVDTGIANIDIPVDLHRT